MRQKASPRMGRRRVWGWRRSMRSKSWNTKKPTVRAKTKNSTVSRITSVMEVEGSLKPVMTVRTTIPSTSSMMAADKIVVPTFPFKWPSSRRAWTVMVTEVAVSTQPRNSARIKESLPTPSMP